MYVHLIETRRNGQLESVKMINSEHPCIEVKKVGSDRCIPLYDMCYSVDIERVKYFRSNPPIDVNKRDGYGWNHVFVACYFGHIEVLKYLCSTYHDTIDVNRPDVNGWTPLYYACHNGHVKIVQFLVSLKKIKIDN
jgi:ankyrin repeat protein